MTASRLIATFFYFGYLRPAPGTWGSLAALPVAWALVIVGGPWALVAGVVVSYVAGHWATATETRGKDDHDPSEIVIDEVCGQWIALLPVAFGAQMTGSDVSALWPGTVAAFIFFRYFDITKPGPVGWADRKAGPTGVMLDDVIAGVVAALAVMAIAAGAHMLIASL